MKSLLERLGLRTASAEDDKMEEAAYGLAAREMAAGNVVPGLMAKAYSRAEGDEKKAKAAYLKLRARQIEVELREAHKRQKEQDAQAKKERKRRDDRERRKDKRSNREANHALRTSSDSGGALSDFRKAAGVLLLMMILTFIAAAVTTGDGITDIDFPSSQNSDMVTSSYASKRSSELGESPSASSNQTPGELSRHLLEGPVLYAEGYTGKNGTKYVAALTDSYGSGYSHEDAKLHLIEADRSRNKWQVSWSWGSHGVETPDTNRIAFRDFGSDGRPSLYWEQKSSGNTLSGIGFYFYDVETKTLHESSLIHGSIGEGGKYDDINTFQLDTSLASQSHRTYLRFLENQLRDHPGFSEEGQRRLLDELQIALNEQKEAGSAADGTSSVRPIGRCNVQETMREDGRRMRFIAPEPIGANQRLHFGGSMHQIGDEVFLSAVVRYRRSAEKQSGPLRIILQNGQAVEIDFYGRS